MVCVVTLVITALLTRWKFCYPMRALAVRLHLTGISLHETAAALEEFGVTWANQAVLQWVHRTAEIALDPPTTRVIGVTVESRSSSELRFIIPSIPVSSTTYSNVAQTTQAVPGRCRRNSGETWHRIALAIRRH